MDQSPHELARQQLEALRWPDGPRCPKCGFERAPSRPNGFYRCNRCELDYTVLTVTLLARSQVQLDKWMHAMRILANEPDIRPATLARELNVTKRTAGLMFDRFAKIKPNELKQARLAGGDNWYARCVISHVTPLPKPRRKKRGAKSGGTLPEPKKHPFDDML